MTARFARPAVSKKDNRVSAYNLLPEVMPMTSLRPFMLILLALAALWPTREPRGDLDAAGQERQLDALVTLDRWALSGPPIADSLGRSALAVSVKDPPNGQSASIELTADFAQPDRRWVSVDYEGPPIPGRCREISMMAWTDSPGVRLEMVLEDSAGGWFTRELSLPSAAAWHRLRAEVGSGRDWRPWLRRGEAARPIEQPVALRRVRLLRPESNAHATVVCRLADLRAQSDQSGFDMLEAQVSSGRAGNVFVSGETPSLQVRMVNRADRPVRIALRLTYAAFDAEVGSAQGPPPITMTRRAARVDLGSVAVAPGETYTRRVRCPTSIYGVHRVVLSAADGARERRWHGSFAYVRASEPGRRSASRRRPPWSAGSRFGICGNIGGFRDDLEAVAKRLNGIAGAGWSRVGLAWQQVNGAPRVWAWDPPALAEGPVGAALRSARTPLRAPHDASQSCPDEVTLAFWARISGPNGLDQVAVRKWGPGDRRNYGAYFDRETGAFTFSAGYENRRGVIANISAGVSAYDGQWHHYAATYSRHIRSVCLYVDGTLLTAANHDGGRLRTTTADLMLAQDFAGDLDEVMVYRRALGPADIAALVRKADPPRDGLVAWYAFNDPARIGRNTAGNAPSVTDLVRDEPDGVKLAREAASEGMATLAILGFPPAWASSQPDAARFWLHEPEDNAWTGYVQQVTRQYKDLIAHWEIWNEPNTDAFWQPRPDPERYLRTLKSAYGAAKRGNPRCTVLMPGLRGPSGKRSPEARAYLDRLLGLGAARYCDAISVHPYRDGSPEETDLVGDLKWIAQRSAVSGARRPLWLTEMGWPTHTPDGVTPRTQAAYLARAYLLAASTGLVERMFWYRLHDSGPDRTYADDNYGLCEEDMTPKPAFFAHRTMAVLLGDARPDGELSVGGGVRALCFRSPQERFAAIWHPSGRTWVAVHVGKQRVTMTDLMGNSASVASPHGVLLLEADDMPKFVRGLSATVKAQSGLIATVGPLPALTSQGPDAVSRQSPPSDVRVRIRNPYPAPVAAAVTATCGRGVEIMSPATKLSIAASGVAEFRLRVRAARGAEPGQVPLTISARLPGGTVTMHIELTVRSAGPRS
ncbi:MAG: LamG domain-containing protein [Chthonomonadales bacterium]|nr:LamG domain-containing protein [Chthonomonadales bacterium]